MDAVTKNAILVLTAIIVAVKLILLIYLQHKIAIKKKQGSLAGIHFLQGISILLFGLIVSRLLFSYFDFVITDFDASTYATFPAWSIWKISMIAVCVTLIYLLWILDKHILENRMKGIPAYVTTLVLSIAMIMPVTSLEDFKLMSLIASLASMSALIVPIVFLFIAKKTTGEIRKFALLISVGIFIYAISAVIVNENLLNENNRTTMWIISVIGKTIGLSLFTLSALKFSE